MIKYSIIKETYLDINKTTYGIFAYNEKEEIVKEIHSCTSDFEKINELAKECTDLELDICHLEDVIEDFLYQLK